MTSDDPLPPTYLPGWHMQEKVKKMKYMKLENTDMNVSAVGLGGSPIQTWKKFVYFRDPTLEFSIISA